MLARNIVKGRIRVSQTGNQQKASDWDMKTLRMRASMRRMVVCRKLLEGRSQDAVRGNC